MSLDLGYMISPPTVKEATSVPDTTATDPHPVCRTNHPSVYEVASFTTRDKWYRVDLRSCAPTCTCDDWRFRAPAYNRLQSVLSHTTAYQCKHLFEVMGQLPALNAAWAAEWEAERQARKAARKIIPLVHDLYPPAA